MAQFENQPKRSTPVTGNAWFAVDKQGLAKILERKGKEFALLELIQNAWDEPGVTTVTASLEYRGRNRALLAVEDDAPEGFKDLSHAFTLFAESAKKSNPEQRGRFNLGEKLVLALCDEVTIQTTQGGLRFEGRHRHALRAKRAVGSRIECMIRMTEAECRQVKHEVGKLITVRLRRRFHQSSCSCPVERGAGRLARHVREWLLEVILGYHQEQSPDSISCTKAPRMRASGKASVVQLDRAV